MQTGNALREPVLSRPAAALSFALGESQAVGLVVGLVVRLVVQESAVRFVERPSMSYDRIFLQ